MSLIKSNNNDNMDTDLNDFEDDEFVQLPGVDDLPLFSNPIAKKLDADVKEKEKTIEDVSDKIGKSFGNFFLFSRKMHR